MLQFENKTGFRGTVFASPDPAGIDSLYAVIKATFSIGQDVAPADEQLDIVAADEHHSGPADSSIRTPSDITLTKPATDVLLVGSAYAPGGRQVGQMDVSLAVGPARKNVRVFGDRHWEATGVGYAMTSPAPFESLPLIWENAFGGTDSVNGALQAEPRNPVGTGFRRPDSETELEGLRLPNLEDPEEPITSWKQAPPPACFAPLSPHWEPRRSYAGTYDERWQQERAPFLPEDFDARFFQAAPPGLVVPGYLRGDESVELHGASPVGSLRFQLPRINVVIKYRLDGQLEERSANLDTVLIEPDSARVILVWRSVLQVDKKLLRVREIEADLGRWE